MKRVLLVLFTCASLAGIQACDNSTAPGDGDKLTGRPIDSSFAIFRLERDSLYWDETASIYGRGFGASTHSVALFVRSHQFDVIEVTDTSVLFRVPRNAESGSFRLHRGSKLADGDVRITIIPQQRQLTPNAQDFEPKHGYPGEKLTVIGSNLVLKQSEVDLWIAERKIRIDSMHSGGIIATIPDDVVSGEVKLRTRSVTRSLGIFTRLEHGGIEQFAKPFKYISAYIDKILIFNNPEDPTIGQTFWEMRDEFFFNMDGVPIQIAGETLMCKASKIDGKDTSWIEMELDFDLATSELSGQITIQTSVTSSNTTTKTTIVLELDQTVIKEIDGVMLLRSRAPEHAARLRLQDMSIVRITQSESTVLKLASVDDQRGELQLRFLRP